jgi:xanthine dehydrogenase accessory factor
LRKKLTLPAMGYRRRAIFECSRGECQLQIHAMKEVLEQIDGWTSRGERAALATVVATRRSAPRPPGAKMAIGEHGKIVGNVSGGCVESAVVAAAEDVLRGGKARVVTFGIEHEKAWDVGLPCGGEIDVYVELYLESEFSRLARAGGRGALVIHLESGARLVVPEHGDVELTLGSPALDDAAAEVAREVMWAERSQVCEVAGVTLFFDVTAPAPRIVVFGAVDYGAALCRVARAAGWRPIVADPRARFATRERFPDAEAVVVAWPREACAQIGGIDRATAVAVMTHDPKIDDEALVLALRSDATYVGAMGSRRAQSARRERLLEAGLTEVELERLAAPIGLDLGAATPEETALSIMADVVAARNGRAGGRLVAGDAPVHVRV